MKNLYFFLLCILSSVLFCSDPNSDDHKKFLSIIKSLDCSNEDIDFVKKYLTNNPKFIDEKHQGYTPLELSIMFHNDKLFDLLINKFVCNIEDKEKDLFCLAIRNFNSNVANHSIFNEIGSKIFLPKNEIEKDEDKKFFLYKLIYSLIIPQVSFLTESLCNVSTYLEIIDNSVCTVTHDSETEEILSCKKSKLEENRLKIWKKLWEKHSKYLSTFFNEKKQTLLHLSIENDLPKVTDFLLDQTDKILLNPLDHEIGRREDPYHGSGFFEDEKERTILDYAILKEDIDFIYKIIEKAEKLSINYNLGINTDLLIKILHKDDSLSPDESASILYNYLNKDRKDPKSHLKIPSKEFIKLLTNRPIHINNVYQEMSNDQVNEYTETILGAASASKMSEETFRYLIKAGADINNFCNYPNGVHTPLMRAAITKNICAARALIQAGAKINRKNNRDETALACASNRNSPHIACMLIYAGANVDALAEYRKKNLINNISNPAYGYPKVDADTARDIIDILNSSIERDRHPQQTYVLVQTGTRDAYFPHNCPW